MIVALTCLVLLAQPANDRPSPAQLQTAEVVKANQEATAAKAENERLNYELIRQQNASWWTMVLSLIGGSGGAVALAKGWVNWRLQQQAVTHKNDMERIKTESETKASEAKANLEAQLKLAQLQIDGKRVDESREIERLKERLESLKSQCERESSAYAADRKSFGEHIARAEAKIESLQSQIERQERRLSYYQFAQRDFPFATWAVSRDSICLTISGNADRNLLVPMGLERQNLENHKEDEFWPPRLAAVLAKLREAAQSTPGHCAMMKGVKIHKNVPKLTIAKILGAYPDGTAWGVQTVVIPETAEIETPPEFMDMPEEE